MKTFENVEWIRPKMNFKQVIEKYGYPFISKEVAECVHGARKFLSRILEEENSTEEWKKRQHSYQLRRLVGAGEYAKDGKNEYGIQNLLEVINKKSMENKTLGGQDSKYRKFVGVREFDRKVEPDRNNVKSNRSMFAQTKWKFMIEAPFEISHSCCYVMKKGPSKKYTRDTGRHPITAQMASESRLRTQKWVQNGCNAFNALYPVSNPMSFWTEQDVLLFIYKYKIPIAKVYGEVVKEEDEPGHQMDLREYGLFDDETPKLRTTGCERTGCMFCGFGCHLNNDERFVRMKETHPKQYEYIMKPWSEGGLGYKDVIDWINENGNLNIRY